MGEGKRADVGLYHLRGLGIAAMPGYTATERRAMIDLLHRSRFAGFDDAKRAWRVSVKRFPDADAAIDAVGAVDVIT